MRSSGCTDGALRSLQLVVATVAGLEVVACVTTDLAYFPGSREARERCTDVLMVGYVSGEGGFRC